MHVPFLDLKAQYRQIEAEVIPAVTEAMATGMFIGGPQVSGFEDEFAAFCDSRYCIGVGSGTDALRFALMAAGVGLGDAVVTVPNTFIATTEAISQVGATPLFVDVDPKTHTLDPQKLIEFVEKGSPLPKIKTPNTKYSNRLKAICPVHLYGQTADMDPILDIARQYGLIVIEDACQAHGASYKGRKAGSLSAAGCFSFYPGKNLGAFGEAGAVVTGDEEMARQMRMIRDHGQAQKYFHDIEGYNGRLDAIQAAVLRIKLKRMQDWNRSRRKSAALYTERLQDVPGITLPVEAEFSQAVYHLYVILADNRDALQKFLSEKSIATGLHYPLPLHLQKAYAYLGHKKGDFPVAESAAERLLSLPMFPELTEDQIDYVCSSIKEFVGI
ncbi:MAG: DegT/DnrJ/EryC1/StrS family aminotransferase [Desulfobacterales bacterium]